MARGPRSDRPALGCHRRRDRDRREGSAASEVGFCLDTCHAYAGGEELSGIADRVKAITGRIDLVHCNN